MSRIAVIFNEPVSGRYESLGERMAVLGVLEEVEAVQQALAELGHSVTRVPLVPPLDRAKETLAGLKADLVFNLFEGFDDVAGAEAAVADRLSESGMPFTGSPGRALSLALDKTAGKALLEAAGIRTPRYRVLNGSGLASFNLGFPCIVKPCAEDASHGISEDSVVHDLAALERQVARVSQTYHGGALVEEYLEGREFNATVMGTAEPVTLPISEIVYTLPASLPRILAFASKWEPESAYYRGTTPVCPADVGPELQRELSECAVSVFRLYGCSGYARVDFRLDSLGQPFVLEANPNCDISPSSGAARQARAAGMSYRQFVEYIVRLALER